MLRLATGRTYPLERLQRGGFCQPSPPQDDGQDQKAWHSDEVPGRNEQTQQGFMGCGFLSAKSLRLLSRDGAVRREKRLAGLRALQPFGVNQTYVARLKK